MKKLRFAAECRGGGLCVVDVGSAEAEGVGREVDDGVVERTEKSGDDIAVVTDAIGLNANSVFFGDAERFNIGVISDDDHNFGVELCEQVGVTAWVADSDAAGGVVKTDVAICQVNDPTELYGRTLIRGANCITHKNTSF